MVGKSWATYSMVDTNFSGVNIVPSGDIVNPIFHVSLIIFFKSLQIDLCD